MIRLDLTPDEAVLLAALLEGDLRRLDWEIARTDQRAFREHLRRREALLAGILDRLASRGEVVGAAGPG